MKQLLFNNYFLNYIGGIIRYLLLKLFNSDLSFHIILYGTPPAKSKKDEIFNFQNGLKNRFIGILCIIVIIIIVSY